MATVGASLKLFDNFSKVMNQTQISMEATLSFAKRLRKEFQKRIVLDVNVTGAIKQLEQVKKRILKLDGAKYGIDIRVSLDTAHALSQVKGLKQQIKDHLGTITAKLNIELPKALDTLLKDLNNSVKSLAAGIEKIKPPDTKGSEESNSKISDESGNESSSNSSKKKGSKSGGSSLFGGAMKMLGGIQNVASGLISHLGGGQQIISSTIGGAIEQQNTKDSLGLLSGSDAKGTAIFDQVSKQALKFGQNMDDAMSNTKSFMPETTDPKQLIDLNKLTMRLANLNPEEGSKGASSAIKSFMSGDSKDLEEKFNMKGSTLQSSSAMKAGKSGDMDGFIKGMDTLLNQSGSTEEVLERMADKPAIQWQKAVANFQFSLADAGLEAMNALGPLGNMINHAFESGKLQPFFDIISNGLTIVVEGIMYLVDRAMWLFGILQDNWPLVRAALLAVALVITGVVLVALYGMAAAWIAAAWPILLIIAIVGMLVYVMQYFGVSTGEIVGVVFGVFAVLFAFLYNNVAFIWNLFASFADFLINLLYDPVFAIKNLFYDLQMTFLGFLYNMLLGVEDFAGGFMTTILKSINKAIEGFNWLGKALSKITGKDFEPVKLLDETNVHAISDKIKAIRDNLKAPTSDNDKAVPIPRMKEKNYKDSFDSGYSTGNKLVNKLTSIKGPKEQTVDTSKDPNDKTNALGKNTNINKVNEVGKIGETVDISSEDLKVMSDLAEMKSIQNFVTLTPTVQVTTGDIHEKADINEIIRGIEETLAGSISTSAQGVYQ